MKIVALASAIVVVASLGCGPADPATKTRPIRRDATISSNRIAEPLRLQIDVTTDGLLRLNDVDTGTLADPTELGERLTVVFSDRDRTGILARDIVIVADQDADITGLIGELERVGARPITLDRTQKQELRQVGGNGR